MVADVSVSSAASRPGEEAPRLSVKRELLIGLAVFAVYGLVESVPVENRRAVADAHGLALHALESDLRIAVARPLNEWLSGHPSLCKAANYEYAVTYVVSAAILLVWLFRNRPERYPVARNSFALINLLAVATFALYPVAPPRLLPDLGFVDTVKLGHTWGSWGSPLVDNANQLAAMPSLHVAWALWVSVELARLSARRSVQAVSLVHVLLTIVVILATANHFLLDAAGAAVLVWLCVYLAERFGGVPRERRVRPADAFFLAVESRRAPQHVGGLIVLGAPDGSVTRERLVALVRDRLEGLPRFRQRLAPRGRWRRPAWSEQAAIDWDWHVPVRDLPAPGGRAALDRLVAELQSEPLPRDRPLWRLVLVRGYEPDRTAVVFLMHHVVADGIGVISHALRLMDDPPDRPGAGGGRGRGPSPLAGLGALLRGGGTRAGPGPFRRAAGTAAGLFQLATESRQGARLPDAATPERTFGTFGLPLSAVRDVARRRGARVTDVMLCAVAGGLSRVCAARGAGADAASPRDGAPGRLRVTVPLMMRTPDTAPEGNYTAAVMVDVPIGAMPEDERLALIARRTGRLHSGTRALASWFVMSRVAALVPPPLHGAFARTVYGGRTFQAIVSNLPGPDADLRLAGAPVLAVHPILPTAPGAPLAVGAIGRHGRLDFGVSAEPALVEDAAKLCGAMRDVIAELDPATDRG
ncbi:phosphatase PAP2 family protein [Actinomadura yumaensis]|uniref:bifunctional phosphatase PAP2/O-acyltransferase family protein n=1 Tax=Actinomadura TaxID=1988 RepID=UPI00136E90E7|nr:phosphatase PAP2 family protein [Actinomadura sp. J1-007]